MQGSFLCVACRAIHFSALHLCICAYMRVEVCLQVCVCTFSKEPCNTGLFRVRRLHGNAFQCSTRMYSVYVRVYVCMYVCCVLFSLQKSPIIQVSLWFVACTATLFSV